MSKRDELIQLNLDQEGIDRAIYILQKMKTVPQGTRVCTIGAYGINASLNKAIEQIGDADILYDHYMGKE